MRLWAWPSLLIVLAATLPAADDAAILAAARAVDIDYQRGLTLLLQDLGGDDQAKRIETIRILGWKQDPDVVPHLIPFLDANIHRADEVTAAAEALAHLGAVDATEQLRRLLNNPDPQLRTVGYDALSWLKKTGNGDYLAKLKDDHVALRAGGATNAGRLQIAEAADILVKALQFDGDPHIRRMAAISLGRLGDRSKAAIVAEALADADPGVRRYAAQALVQLHDIAAIPNLLMALEGNVAGSYVNRCLMLLSGQDFGFNPHASEPERHAAIEKGFVWWAANAKTLQ